MAESTGLRRTKIVSQERAKEKKFIEETNKPLRWVFYGSVALATLILLFGISIKLFSKEDDPPAGGTPGRLTHTIAPQPRWPVTGVWLEFDAPTAGEEPILFPVPPNWTYETGFQFPEDAKRLDVVGAVEKDGKHYSPGQIRLRSKDNSPLKGWIKFTPMR